MTELEWAGSEVWRKLLHYEGAMARAVDWSDAEDFIVRGLSKARSNEARAELIAEIKKLELPALKAKAKTAPRV